MLTDAVDCIFYIGIVSWFSLIALFYEVFDKEYKITYKEKYCETAPDSYSPLIAAHIIKFGVITGEEMVLSLICLENKGAIRFEEMEDGHESVFGGSKWKDIKISKNADSSYAFLPSEEYLINILCKEAGNGESFMTSRLIEILENGGLADIFSKWRGMFLVEAEAYNFLKSTKAVAAVGILAGITYLFAGVYMTAQYQLIKFTIFALLGVLMSVYVRGIKKRTRVGQEEFEKLMAYKRYIKTLDSYSDTEYLYAIVFGLHIKENRYNSFIEMTEPLHKGLV